MAHDQRSAARGPRRKGPRRPPTPAHRRPRSPRRLVPDGPPGTPRRRIARRRAREAIVQGRPSDSPNPISRNRGSMRGVSPRDAPGAGRGPAASQRRADDPGPTPRRTRPGLDLPRAGGALRRIGVGAETQPALDLAVTQEVDEGAGPRRHDAIKEGGAPRRPPPARIALSGPVGVRPSPTPPAADPGEVLVQPPRLVGEASRERVLGHDAHAHLVADEPHLAFEARQHLEERATLRLEAPSVLGEQVAGHKVRQSTITNRERAACRESVSASRSGSSVSSQSCRRRARWRAMRAAVSGSASDIATWAVAT
jgi:hypothetical protein